MKKIIINNKETYFSIDENGKVFNNKTQTYLKGTIRGGYHYYDLRFGNKKHSISAHRLVAEAFLENDFNFPIVHHKDNNRLNNNINNLEWTSYSYNNLSSNKLATTNNYNGKLINSNKWRNYQGSIYNISDKGQVLNTKTNKIMKGKKTSTGYVEYCLNIDKKKKSYLAHRLVYDCFKGIESSLTVINHKDGNKLNNNIENLEEISRSENTIHGIYVLNKKVYQLDKEKNLIRTFSSCAKAAEEMNVKPQTINAAIHKKHCSCGYYWSY